MRIGRSLVQIAGCLAAIALLGGALFAATIVVPVDQPTIQDAVNVAADGDVIMVMPGSYVEQIEIRGKNDVMLKGDQAEIIAPAGMQGSIIKAVNCEDLHITGFKVNGNFGSGVVPGAWNGGGEADTRFVGIRFLNSSGHIVEGAVINVEFGDQHDPSCEQGVGIVVQVDDGVDRNIQIREIIVNEFQWKGIVIGGPVQAKIHKNTVTGWGPTTVITQDCVELGYDIDMTASITNNEFSHAKFTPLTPPACGVLTLEGNHNIRIVRNSIHDCTKGVYVYYVSSDAKIINNTFADNWMDYYTVMECTKIHANTYDP